MVVSVWLRFTNSAACAALRMPRRPASQETTTATRAQSVAAATRQRWQQQQQTAKAKREKKNCHANDSRLQWAKVYCCCCFCSCCQLTTTCSRCCLLPARLHTHRLSALILPAKLARSRFHTPRAPQCYVGAPTRVSIFVEMFGHDVRSARARADCDV